MRPRLPVALGVAALLGAAAARAVPSCRNIAVTPLAFGNYDVYSTVPLDSTATVTYSCPPPAKPTVDISTGNGGSYNPRLMSNGAEALQYNVYTDAARTMVWTTAVPVPQGSGMGMTIYGRIFAQQDVSVGTYSDTLVVTFNF